MTKKILLPALLQLCMLAGFAQVKIQHLLTENLTNPIGLDVPQPRFSWQLASDKRNVVQTAYELKVSADKGLVWNSGKVSSNQSVQVPYAGATLETDKKYTWELRVWDNNGKPSPWSEPAFFQTALLNTSDWKAKWIEAGFEEDASRPAILFRNQFAVNKKIKSAALYITSHGLYEVQLNGNKVGDAYLTPGWTSYNKRLQYQVYDVTNMIARGDNAIGAMVGNGWYRGYLAWDDNKNIYGKKLGLLAQLSITYSDGTTQNIVTDESWKSSTGAIKSVEIYHGETIDARAEQNGWSKPGFNDAAWKGVSLLTTDMRNLVATENEPVRKHETFKAIKLITTPSGEKVLDFGQNLVGWVVVKATGNAGDKIVLKHAEVLDKQGNFYTENLRAAKATATYILKGGAAETFEPHFTFYGFRYLKIENYPGEINPDNFTAVALYSDMKPTGTFTSSNALVNQLQHNIQWGQRGNFLDVPTDCPQRDERLGWTGDAQAFSRTATFNFGVNSFFSKWLKDVAADQEASGLVPHVIPNVLGKGAGGSTGWADVATIIPWNMYLAYGDKKILETQYPSMKAWVKYMTDASKNDLWNTGFHFGDWLFYRPFDDNDGRAAVTDKYMIAQCFFANSVQLLINSAKVLNKPEDEIYFTGLLKKVKDAFLKEYVTPNGRLISGTQTAYVLALNFDMLPENLRTQAAGRLAENVKSYDTHLTTGFLGTPYLCHVLTRFGYTDLSYQLLLQEDYPSWLYPVKMGATTIWERWDGQKPDSTFQTPGMNSFNHYAYGAIGVWMYRQMVGLDTYEDGVGYKHIKVKPHIGGGFTNAAASLQTYYGTLSSGWKIENSKIWMEVEIPANTTATVYVPAANAGLITESDRPLVSSTDIKISGEEDGYVVLQLGSGKYHFVVTK
jgi:alpha-L-rhamnosidase